jgi:hypothetical protein
VNRYTIDVVTREWPGKESRTVKTVVDAEGVERVEEKVLTHGRLRELGQTYVVDAQDEESARRALQGVLGEGLSLEVFNEGPSAKTDKGDAKKPVVSVEPKKP